MKTQKPGWQYQAVDINTGVIDADPHKLIQILYAAAIDSIAVARGCIDRSDTEGRGLAIGKAIGLVGGLSDSLNHDIVDGGIADNLAALYDYVTRELAIANVNSDPASLDRAREVLIPLQDAWNGIRSESKQLLRATAAAS